MFRLARLQLSGFKSFVEPVGLDFGGGMTGIVGPNGCGKSNLADAMVWVMGERSAKILRGQTMEDVIFAGSARRKPLGMAEVSLTLERPGVPADDGGRLTIGRRLFRSGESQYLIDGRRARLKDVRDLLMDTGLGVRAYSVIEQGRIGTILSGKPLERRRLLEEAAGITHYRERRRLAEIKLEEALANLARLEDIVAEVERALRSLKRQAGAARRYGERKERYRRLQRQLLEGRWAEISAARSGLTERLAARVAAEAEVTARLHRQEADLAEGRERLEELNRALAELHRENADVAARIEGKQEFIKGSRERLEEIGERLRAGRAAEGARGERLRELEQEIERLEGRGQELSREHDRAASEVSEDDRRISQVERQVAESEQQVEALRGRLLASIGEINTLTSQLHREQLDLEKGRLRGAQVAEDLTARTRESADEAQRAAGAEREVSALRERVAQSERRLGEQKAALDRLRHEEAKLTERRNQVAESQQTLERRRDLLVELDRAHRERRENVAQAFAGAGLPQPRFLADRLKAPDGWEASLDLFFSGLGDAVLVPEGDRGLETAQALAEGSLTIHLVDRGDRPAPHAAPSDPAVRSSLAEALDLDAEVAAALPPAYLVDTAADAARLARRHNGVAFLSRDRFWAHAGVLHAQGRQAGPGAFAREHELEEVRQAIPPLREELDRLTAAIEECVARAAQTRQQMDRIERQLAEARQKLAVAEARHQDLDARSRRLEVERQTLETESGELDRELAMAQERAERLQADLERLRGLHTSLEEDFDAAQQRVEQARGDREAARTSGASRRGRLELAAERLESHRAELARAEREAAETRRQIDSWSEESARLEDRREQLRTAIKEAGAELQEALEQRDRAQVRVRQEQERLEGRRGELKQAEEGLEARRQERDELRDRIGELRVEEAALAQDAGHLATTFREEFGEAPPGEPGDPPENLDELEAKVERTREQLERLGPVNLLAAEEYAEQEERHTFLTEQRADVKRSVERLKETIREINRTSTERFAATFETVNDHFRQTFTDLFRGGTAEMRLLDEDDLLESGIEIVARPPGKRLQNLMLLSGGEKALTAIALLFALFKTKPSPFCILDEVDAPLDDLNTLRFVELLKTMSAETQFIVVTHNKITMEAMSTLYGVTMQERGVSSLVSVELDELQPEEQPVAAAAG